MNRKIIYIAIGRLTDKMVRDCYIDHLLEKGATIEYWDVVSLFRKNHSESHGISPSYLRIIHSFGEIQELLQTAENRDAFYVVLFGYMGRFARLFRLLSKYNCRMLTFVWGTLPRDPSYKWRKIAAWLSTPDRCAQEILNRAKASAFRRLKLVRPYEVTFAAGSVALANSGFAAKVVPINYFDYDEYLKALAKPTQRLVSEPYAVFLDINLPFHPDHASAPYSQIDPQLYFRSVNRFFGVLEREYGIKVVIAAHPKADYDDHIFEGRQISRLVTAPLVRDAEFVLSHSSTAMSFAVLNCKPLIFIYTDEMARLYQHWIMRDIRVYAEYLDAAIYNIDRIQSAQAKQVNAACYDRYKYNFLTSRQSEGLFTRDILWRELAH